MCFVAWFCLAVVCKVVTGIDMFARFVNWMWVMLVGLYLLFYVVVGVVLSGFG